MKISASIMCADWMNLGKDIRILEQANVDYIHYDIMDGFFCPDYCLGTNIINVIRQNTTIPSDYHLMVEEPSRILDNFVPKEGDILSIHYEACRNLHRDIIKIKRMGFKVGVYLNPATPASVIEYIIEEIDVVSVMTVNPGYSGQKLVPQTLDKVVMLNDWRRREKFNFEISIDGNVNSANVPNMVRAGADILVGGSSGLFIKGQSPMESISKLRGYIKDGLNNANKTGN
ncbi:MAG: ribulose-phosphate 3-epimerase [Anaerohalosphaeraceae bacterium]|nr:ribulose-phosphate 3-epimerase [Anaerohalosphaeraceae bacterium]